MNTTGILDKKRVLVVDDEPDILETVTELLDMCETDTATSFLQAVTRLKSNVYHLAILDIMGVNGYDLLEATRQLKIPTIMLTAHALSPESLKTSIEMGANAYVPKDRLADLAGFAADVLTAGKKGAPLSQNWFSLLKPVFDKLFGENWRDPEKEFWDRFEKKHFDESGIKT